MEQGNVFRRRLDEGHQKLKGVSIPLEQGNVFRLVWLNDFDSVECLNPFGTGQCLSTLLLIQLKLQYKGLNPFGTGQCLSTEDAVKGIVSLGVSIPLEQGNVFRRYIW